MDQTAKPTPGVGDGTHNLESMADGGGKKKFSHPPTEDMKENLFLVFSAEGPAAVAEQGDFLGRLVVGEGSQRPDQALPAAGIADDDAAGALMDSDRSHAGQAADELVQQVGQNVGAVLLDRLHIPHDLLSAAQNVSSGVSIGFLDVLAGQQLDPGGAEEGATDKEGNLSVCIHSKTPLNASNPMLCVYHRNENRI